MNNHAKKSDARANTRDRLREVFDRLLLAGEVPRPKVQDIIAEAKVSRSTFYDHFDGVEALLNESLEGLFGAIANSLTGEPDDAQLKELLAHIWQNRPLGREFLTGLRAERAEAMLARQIEARLPQQKDRRLLAILTAGVVVTALGNWVSEKLAGSPDYLSDCLQRCVSAILSNNGS